MMFATGMKTVLMQKEGMAYNTRKGIRLSMTKHFTLGSEISIL